MSFKKRLSQTYWERYRTYGATPRGSFWLTKARQDQRFKLILTAMANTQPPRDITLADVGCGYGALAHYLAADRQFDDVTYTGYDISLDLVNECQSKFDDPRFRFVLGTRPEAITACVVMSGTYNLAATLELAIWEDYVTECLQNCWRKTSHAMIFNLQIAPKAYIAHDSIYYAHCDNVLELCHKLFGPTKIIVDRNLSNDATFCVTK